MWVLMRELRVSMVTHKMVMIDATTPREVVDAVLGAPVSRLPLWRDCRQYSRCFAREGFAARAARGRRRRLQDRHRSAGAPAWFVPDTTPLYEQFKAFRDRKTPFALVVDEYGELEGLVTIKDIIAEIVGDISDEHEISVAGVRMLPDGSANVDGAVPVRDLNRAWIGTSRTMKPPPSPAW